MDLRVFQLADLIIVVHFLWMYGFLCSHINGRSSLENLKVKYLKLLYIFFHGHVYFQSCEIWQDKKQKSISEMFVYNKPRLPH